MSKHRGGNGYANGGNGRAEEVNTTLMELENNSRWEELGSQVSLLKELSMDINNEVKSQNRLLDGMGSTFGSTSELFKNTIGKLGMMLNTGGSNHMFYLIGFIVFIFILLYYLMGRK